MDDLKVRRWAGGFGVAGFIVFLVVLLFTLLAWGLLRGWKTPRSLATW